MAASQLASEIYKFRMQTCEYDPPPPVPPDGRFHVRVRFSQPGEFVLRATALDGVLWANRDLHVTVNEADWRHLTPCVGHCSCWRRSRSSVA